MNKSKYFLKPCIILAVVVLFLQVFPIISIANAQLPLEMQMDVLMTELKQALQAKQHREVLRVTKKLRGLSGELPNSILFIEARALAAINQNSRAKKAVETYLKKAGKDAKFYGEAIKLYVQVNKKVENANRAQAKSQAVKKQAARKKGQAAAVRNKRLRQIVKLPGQPEEFARLPDGRFAILGITKEQVGRRKIMKNFWVMFFQANGQVIRTHVTKVPTGMVYLKEPGGLGIYPGGKYILTDTEAFTKLKTAKTKQSGECIGPYIFSREGVLLPRQGYLSEITENFGTSKLGWCEGGIRFATTPEGTGILIARKGGKGKIHVLNKAGKIIQSRDVDRPPYYNYGRIYALSDNKFITTGYKSDYQLHQGAEKLISQGQIPGKDGGLYRGVVPLPSGGWGFQLTGTVEKWQNGVKGFSAKGAPVWFVKPACGVRARKSWPVGLWAQGNTLFALYKINYRDRNNLHCVQKISATGRNLGRAHTIAGLFATGWRGEKIIGFTVDPKTGDRMFVIDAPKEKMGYLMRTDARLRQKQW